MRTLILFALFPFAIGLTACGSSDSGASAAPPGRGSAACHEWQSALCDAQSRCGASAAVVATCRDQAAGTTCQSDQAASDCATTLAAPGCAFPAECQIKAMADPAPALTACAQYTDTVCSGAQRCGDDKATCLADPTIATVCTGVIGYKTAFEACISAINALSCSAQMAPAVCEGVFLK